MTSDPDGPGVGQLAALILALSAAGAMGFYQPPAPRASSAWGPGWITATAGARLAATRTAVAIRDATATAAAMPTVTPTPSPAPAFSGAVGEGEAVEGVMVDAPAPYFTFGRPFAPANETRASRFYPYGTTADGAYLLHHGVDIGNAMGTPVLAIADGEVVFAGLDLDPDRWGPQPDFYGRLVVLRHPQTVDGLPLFSLYGHVSETTVAVGQAVARGDTIARVGSAGVALGPHLHLEVRVGPSPADYGRTRNAELFLAPLAGHGTIVGRVVDAAGRPISGITLGLYAVEASGQERWVGQSTTYPPRNVNPSPAFEENFLFADTPAGRYVVSAIVAGRRVAATARVTDGGVVGVELRASP